VREVQPVTDGQRERLEQTMPAAPSCRARRRAPSLGLSAAGMTSQAMAKPYQVHRLTVSAWSKTWEQPGVQRVQDQPRSGRPRQRTPDAPTLAPPESKAEPRSLPGVVERCAHKTAQRLSLSTRKRLAKQARLRWQRVSKSCKKRRDPDALAPCQRALTAWQHPEAHGTRARYDCDAAGWALEPTSPYAWQEPKRVIEWPARRSGRMQVLGVRNRHHALHALLLAQAIHTGVVLAGFDAFCHTMTQPTVGVVDHAAIHSREALADRLPAWKKRGGIMKYLSPSSPAFHLIAILGRRITYTWLPFSA
jgi:transposase